MTTSDTLDEELSHRRNAAGENRIPPALAVLFAVVVYALLPKSLLLGPRFAVPIIELALLAALIATNPRRMCGKAGGRGSPRLRWPDSSSLPTWPHSAC